MTVRDLWFESEGTRCRAWLHLPPEAAVPPPVVVMAHGYSATHGLHYWREAEHLAANGYAVLDFDPRFLGASEGEPRQMVSVRKQRADLRAAVAFARTLDDVDRGRVALFGSSLGGGLVLDLAAEDPEIAAVVAVVPLVDGLTSVPGLPVRARLRLASRGVADRLGRLRGRPPRTMPVFGEPGDPDALLDRDDGADTVREEIRDDVGSPYRNECTVWEALESPLFRPIRKVRRIGCPTLMVCGTRDTVNPIGPQRRAARRNPLIELAELDANHFDPFRPSRRFAEVAALELAFLRAKLPAPG